MGRLEFMKKSVIVAKLLKESVVFAFSALKGDKFRTLLSLLGVSIGIFSIVAVFSAVDALRDNVKRGFESFGSDVVNISQWPMAGEDDAGNIDMTAEYKWWEYMRRPSPSVQDYKFLKENSKTASAVAMGIQFSKTVKFGRNSVSECTVTAASYDWNRIAKVNLEAGRYFTEQETNMGNPVGIIGHNLWMELFNGVDPIDKKIKVGNREITVIGVFEKQGESMVDMGGNTDESVLIPLDFGRYMINLRWADASIYAKPKENVDAKDFYDELLVLMRSHRRLAPGEKNDFSINRMTFVMELVGSVFSMINNVGWIIAGFSLLIGGFGIANIMFVSVKERTNIIGIQKALGAKKYVILTQFLAEAVFLAITGGAIGIILVGVIIQLIPSGAGFIMQMSVSNIISGLAISSVIGIISGLIPAYTAANLAPVEAINSK